jgi:autotransporter-associated beta strand protein
MGWSNNFLLGTNQVWKSGGAGSTLTINGNIDNGGYLFTLDFSQPIVVNGSINGAGNIVKSGTSTLTLNGANTYTGTTTISNGTLRVDGSLAAGSAVTVAGGTLQGAGTVHGSVDVQAGGTLAPGSGAIGTQTINGPATNSGTIVAEITSGPSADKIVFGSSVLLGGTLTVTGIGSPLTSGQTFDLFDFTSAPSGAFGVTNLPGGLSHWNTGDLLAGGTITFTNNTPVAASFGLGVAVGGSVVAQVVGKYATDADPGDSLTITNVSAVANGTLQIVGGTNLVYTSTNSAAGETFTYTVSDGLASATGTVTVSTYSPEGFNRLSPPSVIGPGTVALSYLGIPGYNYALDWATNLTPPINWTALVTNTAADDGSLSYTNTTTEPANFFRTRHVP